MIPAVTEQDKQECIDHFRNLIRLNTTNPPGNEIIAVNYLKDIFDKEGIHYDIIEAAPTRASIIARLKGNGEGQPILLTSHLDVVPHDPEHWSVDPFAADIKDGYIYGRGAVDMKNITSMELAVFLKIKRSGLPLKRDIIFAAIADEEAGCTHGSSYIVENHPDLVRAEYGINEVGGFSVWIDDVPFYPIGVAEKGVCWFEITAEGTPGHGGLPHKDQAVEKIANAAAILARNNLPYHNHHVVNSFVDGLCSGLKFPKSMVLKGLKSSSFSSLVINNVIPDKKKAQNFWNMFRNSVTPTMLNAGEKPNVIPSAAKLTVDGRIVPGSSVEEFLREIESAIGPGFKYNVLHSQEPCVHDFENDFYNLLGSTLQKHHPGCRPIPFLIPGFSDSNNYSKLGNKMFGFAPVKLPKDLDFGGLYHAHDERIPIKAMEFAVDVLWDVVSNWCIKP